MLLAICASLSGDVTRARKQTGCGAAETPLSLAIEKPSTRGLDALSVVGSGHPSTSHGTFRGRFHLVPGAPGALAEKTRGKIRKVCWAYSKRHRAHAALIELRLYAMLCLLIYYVGPLIVGVLLDGVTRGGARTRDSPSVCKTGT